MNEVLLSGLSTHEYKSLNKAAGGMMVYDYKAHMKNHSYTWLSQSLNNM